MLNFKGVTYLICCLHEIYIIINSFLTSFLSGFNSSIQLLTEPLIKSIIEIYQNVIAIFRPLPKTPHYAFNTMDIVKCLRSLLQAEPTVYTQQLQILRLFRYESERVFCDRLSNMNDKLKCSTVVKEICEKYFNEPILADNENLLFANFVNPNKGRDIKSAYVEIRDITKLKTVIANTLVDMNKDLERKENLVLFQETIEQLVRIVRVLGQEQGNCLLLGKIDCGFLVL